MGPFRIAVLQITSIDDVQANLDQIFKLLKKIETKKVDAAFLPENCLYMRTQEGAALPAFQLSDRCFVDLQNWVDQFGCALHLGSVPLLGTSGLVNASIWLEPGKPSRHVYSKMHLFDIELEGQKPIRESDVFKQGPKPEVLEFKGWRWGLSICYDLRFSELYSEYAKLEVDGILIPSSFLVPTGQAHWDVLMRARAIESQCYVVASAQMGTHRGVKAGERLTYGHSLVVDPWGIKVVEMQLAPDVQICELSQERIQSVRRQIPMKKHRRNFSL